MILKDGELALWVTERKQLPDKRWRISIWLNTEENLLSMEIHDAVASLVSHMMKEATDLSGEHKTERSERELANKATHKD